MGSMGARACHRRQKDSTRWGQDQDADRRDSCFGLNFPPAEEIVLFARGAVGALQAANKEDSHAHCDQDGDDVLDGFEPSNQAMHMRLPFAQENRKLFAAQPILQKPSNTS